MKKKIKAKKAQSYKDSKEKKWSKPKIKILSLETIECEAYLNVPSGGTLFYGGTNSHDSGFPRGEYSTWTICP